MTYATTTVDYVYIRVDDREVYPIIRKLGDTVNHPTEITKSAPLLNTLSRPPPEGGFSFGGACSSYSLPSTRRKYDRGDPRNFWSVKYCA